MGARKMMTSSLFIVLALAVVAIIIIIAGIRLQPDKGGEDVIRNVYIYLVLFATLMMTIGGSVGAFMAIADIIAPAPYYQTFEEFQRWGNEKVYPDREDANEEKLSQEELKTRYDAMVRTGQ
jgi:Ca2+/Na+ antiporter